MSGKSRKRRWLRSIAHWMWCVRFEEQHGRWPNWSDIMKKTYSPEAIYESLFSDSPLMKAIREGAT